MAGYRSLIKSFLIIIATVAVASFLFSFAPHTYAQDADQFGLQAVGQETGLSANDPRVIAGRIIKGFLGFLGVIAVGIILYAGFLYMTSGGMPEKVDKARKYIISAIIGLAIILLAYAIVTYVFNRLGWATTAGEGTEYEGGDGGLPMAGGDYFYVKSISPTSPPDRQYYNYKITFVFNQPVDVSTVTAASVRIVKQGESEPITGDFVFENNNRTLVFYPRPCWENPEDTQDYCLEKSTTYEITLNKNTIKSSVVVGGQKMPLYCGLCSATLTTGELRDSQGPSLSFIEPYQNKSFCNYGYTDVQVRARDNDSVSNVSLYIDDKTPAEILVDNGEPVQDLFVYPWSIEAPEDSVWPARRYLRAAASDNDNNFSQKEIYVKIWDAACCDPSGDIGCSDDPASGCPRCSGCTEDDQCAQECDETTGQCVDYPTITDIAPTEGAPGNLITIAGSGFLTYSEGASKVFFTGADGQQNIAAAMGCGADNSWRNEQIVVQVPSGAQTGPLKVMARSGDYDDTENERGWQGNFTVDSSLGNPGLCSVLEQTCVAQCASFAGCPDSCVDCGEGDDCAANCAGCLNMPRQCRAYPDGCAAGLPRDVVDAAGQGLGQKDDNSELYFGLEKAITATWTDAHIADVPVPVVPLGLTRVAVAKGERCRTARVCEYPPVCVDAAGQACAEGSSGCVCEAPRLCDFGESGCVCTGGEVCEKGSAGCVCAAIISNPVKFKVGGDQLQPKIVSLSPDAGYAGSLLTISGENFGRAPGRVILRSAERGNYNAVLSCGDSAWTDTQIVVKVPDNIYRENAPGTGYQVSVVTADNLTSNSKYFAAVTGLAGPGICSLAPDNGPANTVFKLSGENFGFAADWLALSGEFLPQQRDYDIVFSAAGQSVYSPQKPLTYLPPNETEGETVYCFADVAAGCDPLRADCRCAAGSISACTPGTPLCKNIYINCPAGAAACDPFDSDCACAVSAGTAVTNFNPRAYGWEFSLIKGAKVPSGAVTGELRLVGRESTDGAGKQSNPVNFRVAKCTADADCQAGEVCCSSGVCQPLDNQTKEAVCQPEVVTYDSEFAYVISTGPMPDIPRVLERSCDEVLSQSPSPYKGTLDACPNAAINATFNTQIDPTSFENSVIVKRCTAMGDSPDIFGPPCDLDGCYEPVLNEDGSVRMESGNVVYAETRCVKETFTQLTENDLQESNLGWVCEKDDGTRCLKGTPDCDNCDPGPETTMFLLNESYSQTTVQGPDNARALADLAGNKMFASTWYQVEIKGKHEVGEEVRGIKNTQTPPYYMPSDYQWRFRTRGQDCIPDKLLVSPGKGMIESWEEVQRYFVCGLFQCQMILMSDKPWDWQVLPRKDVSGNRLIGEERAEFAGYVCKDGKIDSLCKEAGACEHLSGGDCLGTIADIRRDLAYYRIPLALQAEKNKPVETPRDDLVRIKAEIHPSAADPVGYNKEADLEINFGDPKVVNYFPNCTAACVNALVGVDFNVVMDKTSFTDNFILYKCATSECFGFAATDKIAIDEVDYLGSYDSAGRVTSRATLNLGNFFLAANTYYRAIVKNSITSQGGRALTGLNYSTAAAEVNCKDGLDNDFVEGKASDGIDLGGYDSDDDGELNVVSGCYNETMQSYANFLPVERADQCGENTEFGYHVLNSSGVYPSVSFNVGTGDLNSETYVYYPADPQCASLFGNETGKLPPNDAFSWIFKTGASAEPCKVDRIAVLPQPYVTEKYGEEVDYSATPYSAPDACASKGQALNPWSYSWQWGVDEMNGEKIANITQLTFKVDAPTFCTENCLNKGTPPKKAVCGDGEVEAGEECDDGNINIGDGCSDKCLLEPFANCTTLEQTNCCGNGQVEIYRSYSVNGETRRVAEECDLGCDWRANNQPCQPGSEGCVCVSRGVSCTNGCLNAGTDRGFVCGNGIEDPGEDADISGADYLDNKCLNKGAVYQKTGTALPAMCGNGILEQGEECENPAGNPYCNDRCLWQGFPKCAGKGVKKCHEVVSPQGNTPTSVYQVRLKADAEICAVSSVDCLCLEVNCCGNGVLDTYSSDGAQPNEECELSPAYCTRTRDCTLDDEGCVNGKITENCYPGATGCQCRLPDYCSTSCLNVGSKQSYYAICGDGRWGFGEDYACEQNGAGNTIWGRPFQIAKLFAKADVNWVADDWNTETRYSEKDNQITASITETSELLASTVPENLDAGRGDLTLRTKECFIDPPVVLATIPVNNSTDVCRNAMIYLKFDKAVLQEQTSARLIEHLPAGQICGPTAPVLQWSFDQGAGTIANDSIGKSSGNIVKGFWEAGIRGSGLRLFATPSASVGWVEKSDLSFNWNKSWSISMWVAPDFAPVENCANINDCFSRRYILWQASNGASGTASQSIEFSVMDLPAGSSARVFTVSVKDKDGIKEKNVTIPEIDNNSWQYLSVEYNGQGLISVYRNGGVYQNVMSLNFDAPSVNKLTVGSSLTHANGYQGKIDEFRMYNTELTREEVNVLYNQFRQTTWLERGWEKVKNFVFNLLVKVGVAQVECKRPVSWEVLPQGDGTSALLVTPQAMLSPTTSYTLKINAANICGKLAERILNFTTSGEFCRVEQVAVDPAFNFVIESDYTRDYLAFGQTNDGQILAEILGLYEWNWSWNTTDQSIVQRIVPDLNESIASALVTTGSKNGKAQVRPRATITTDELGGQLEQSGININTTGSYKQGIGEVEVMICDNPWNPDLSDRSCNPAVAGCGSGKFWQSKFAAEDGKMVSTFVNEWEYNAGLFYCRDFGEASARHCYDGITACDSNADCAGIGDGVCHTNFVCGNGTTPCNGPNDNDTCRSIGNGKCQVFGEHDDLPNLKLGSGDISRLGDRYGVYVPRNGQYLSVPYNSLKNQIDFLNEDDPAWTTETWIYNTEFLSGTGSRIFYFNKKGTHSHGGNQIQNFVQAGFISQNDRTGLAEDRDKRVLSVFGVFNGQRKKYYSTQIIPDGFVHVAITYSAPDGLKMYIDGALEPLIQYGINGASLSSSWQDLYIGGLPENSTDRGLNGYIDEFRMWNYARSAQEISSQYRQTLTGNENGLVEYLKFETNLRDTSGHENDAIFVDNSGSGIVYRDLAQLAEELGVVTATTASGNQCQDSIDNDANGLIDLADYKCTSAADDFEMPKLLAQYFFSRDESDAQTDLAPDGVSLRIYENPEGLAPDQWYARYAPNAVGSLSAVNVDCQTDDFGQYCYAGAQDRGSLYVAAANKSRAPGSKNVYNNIYLLGYSEGANQATQNIFSQLVRNLKFNMDVLSDSAAGIAVKSKFVRDTERLTDWRRVYSLIEKYRMNNGGRVPYIDSGSYIRGETYSIWPSWQNELGTALGSALPVDPRNHLAWAEVGANYGGEQCGAGMKCPPGNQCVVPGQYCAPCPRSETDLSNNFDPITCYNPLTLRFATASYTIEGNSSMYFYRALKNSGASDAISCYDGAACPINDDCAGHDLNSGFTSCGNWDRYLLRVKLETDYQDTPYEYNILPKRWNATGGICMTIDEECMFIYK